MKLDDIKPHKEWSTGQLQELAESLERDFQQGYVIEETEKGTLRISFEHAVGRLGKLKFEVFSKEHAPPHFRVTYGDESANFSIRDCTKLNGGLNQYEKNIAIWHRENKQAIIDRWNATRPSDCPVGPYVE
ncbi:MULTISPECIES: DUF4160 domain-containing protein [unclassified Xanthomonas]|uniref:DUF4160 domain-containing protein n=1 Tax=unclassified Xanthomonas TaxID=2643310 RepID=UPI0009D9DC00|nr:MULTISPECIES: DUF4160 domain-containing protein [unclassified Xanthomonas]KAB7764003.1 DUF4160 domain-containing protein [Xanthomonas sp. LMG 12461]